jgi:hypothetical protein
VFTAGIASAAARGLRVECGCFGSGGRTAHPHYTIADLLTPGASVGLTDAHYVDAVRAQTYAAWARQVDEQASRNGNTATPELILDGHELPASVVFDPTALHAALTNYRSRGTDHRLALVIHEVAGDGIHRVS